MHILSVINELLRLAYCEKCQMQVSINMPRGTWRCNRNATEKKRGNMQKSGGGVTLHVLSDVNEDTKRAWCKYCNGSVILQKNKYNKLYCSGTLVTITRKPVSISSGICRHCDSAIKNDKTNRRSYCKTCQPNATAWQRLKNYGISQDEFDAMYFEQCGSCYICKNSEAVCVDHDHDTGKVRALLCNGCNTGIGGLQDSPKILRLAAIYLEEYGKVN